MANANKLVIPRIEDKNGAIFLCSLRPCLSKMSSQLYGSREVWSDGLPVERWNLRLCHAGLCRMGRRIYYRHHILFVF